MVYNKKAQQKYKKTHRKKINQYKKNYYSSHSKEREKAKERAYKWRKENPKKYKLNFKKAKKKWNKANPDKIASMKKRRYARERGAEGSHTLQEWENLKEKFNYCCAICGMQEPFTDQWYQWLTEDHIIPLSKGGSNYIENIQPLCMRCNSKKNNNG